MPKTNEIWIVGEFRKIDMEQVARVIAMLVEERHRARVRARQQEPADSTAIDSPREA